MNPGQKLTSMITRVREKVHPAILILVVMLIVFGFIFAFSEPLPYQAAPAQETIAPTRVELIISSSTPSAAATDAPTPTPQFTPTQTSLPPEYLENREQSIGIIAGTVMLVILVIGGTLGGALARRREKK